ncbi:MAG: VOC family protein [Candidatus Marinimicrobia bacterium]|nr:VOC family protein [Candidatus Neomarinimicrobiota bacterium]
MGRVVHFEIAADDMERAVKFYKEVFGWDIKKWGGPIDYWLTTTGDDDTPGINGGILPRDPNYPGVMNTIAVESVDKAVAVIEKNGGNIIAPKAPVPGVGWFAYFADTEGNVQGIMEDDPEAK